MGSCTSWDANNDGLVDGGDYTLWADNYLLAPATSLTFSRGDFNRDGVVDAADYTLWEDNFQPQPSPPAPAAAAQAGISDEDIETLRPPQSASASDVIAVDAIHSVDDAVLPHAAIALDPTWLGWLAMAAHFDADDASAGEPAAVSSRP